MSQSFFDNLNAKQGMVLGIAFAVAVGSVVGFLSFSGGISLNFSKGKSMSNVGSVGGVTITQDDWVRGNPDAKVTIVEFSDLECPFCARFHPTVQQALDEYGDQVNWVWKHFPLNSIHPKAQKFAEGAECAGAQGGNDAFWAYIDAVMENQSIAVTQLGQLAANLGLNQATFETCLNAGTYAGVVQEQTQQAQAAGGSGTPYSVIIAGQESFPISGAQPYAQLKAIIDSLL